MMDNNNNSQNQQLPMTEPQPILDGQPSISSLQPVYNLTSSSEQPVRQRPKRTGGFVKFFRVIIWGLVASILPISIYLKSNAKVSASYANGSYALKSSYGDLLFWFILVVGILNLIWGTIRWILRWKKEKWAVGKAIGKLIGGGIWRFFAIAPIVLISFFFLAKTIDRIITDQSREISAITNVGNSTELDPANLQKIIDNINPADHEKLQYLYDQLTLTSVDFGNDASSNISRNSSLFSQNVYAADKGVEILNKAILTENKRFVVFYTDKGDNEISDEKAREIGEMLENLVDKYKTELSQDWKYEQHTVTDIFSPKMRNIQKVLKNNSIDENILSTAMPIYIVDPHSKQDFKAQYSNQENANFVKTIARALGSDLDNTVISYPFIVFMPKEVDDPSLDEIVAHELSHHYADRYCRSHYGNYCQGDYFIIETSANYMAAVTTNSNTMLKDDFLNSHHMNYIYYGACYSIDEIVAASDGRCNVPNDGSLLGYSTFAFLYNYAQIVPNANDIILQANNQKDALNFLYDNAGTYWDLGQSGSNRSNFEKVMLQLTERNLTNDYGDKKSMYASKLPFGEDLPCKDYCSKEYNLAPAASQYFYFSAEEYNNTKITIDAAWSDFGVSILGQNQFGKWSVITSSRDYYHENLIEYEIKEPNPYKVIAVAVTNYNKELSDVFTLKIANDALSDIIDDGLHENSKLIFEYPGEIFTDIGNGCHEAHLDNLFDAFSQLAGIGGELLKMLTELDPGNDYNDLKGQVDEDVAMTQKNIAEAKKNTEDYRITLCTEYIKKGRSFDQTKSDLQNTLGLSFDIHDGRDTNTRTSTFFSLDLINRSGKIYTLLQVDDELGLMTINITEK